MRTVLRWLGYALAATLSGVLIVAAVLLGLAFAGVCVCIAALAERVDPGGIVVQMATGRSDARWFDAPMLTYQGGRITTDARSTTDAPGTH